LKPVAWAKTKMPWIAPRPAYPSKLLIRSILLKAIRARRMVFERILAHRINCQRARPPCPAERLPNNQLSIGNPLRNVNTSLTAFLRFPQPSTAVEIRPINEKKRGAASLPAWLNCSSVERT